MKHSIEEIEKMLEGISKPPWDYGVYMYTMDRPMFGTVCYIADRKYVKCSDPLYRNGSLNKVNEKDGEFIAAAPEIVRELVDEVKMLQEECSNLISHLRNIMVVGTKSQGNTQEAEMAYIALSQIENGLIGLNK